MTKFASFIADAIQVSKEAEKETLRSVVARFLNAYHEKQDSVVILGVAFECTGDLTQDVQHFNNAASKTIDVGAVAKVFQIMGYVAKGVTTTADLKKAADADPAFPRQAKPKKQGGGHFPDKACPNAFKDALGMMALCHHDNAGLNKAHDAMTGHEAQAARRRIGRLDDVFQAKLSELRDAMRKPESAGKSDTGKDNSAKAAGDAVSGDAAKATARAEIAEKAVAVQTRRAKGVLETLSDMSDTLDNQTLTIDQLRAAMREQIAKARAELNG